MSKKEERKNMKQRRNDPCNCGSGKKYKMCCLRNEPIKKSNSYKKSGGTQTKKHMNDIFFNRVSSLSKSYIWPDKGHIYQIKDGAFYGSVKAIQDLRSITTSEFHNKTQINNKI